MFKNELNLEGQKSVLYIWKYNEQFIISRIKKNSYFA